MNGTEDFKLIDRLPRDDEMCIEDMIDDMREEARDDFFADVAA